MTENQGEIDAYPGNFEVYRFSLLRIILKQAKLQSSTDGIEGYLVDLQTKNILVKEIIKPKKKTKEHYRTLLCFPTSETKIQTLFQDNVSLEQINKIKQQLREQILFWLENSARHKEVWEKFKNTHPKLKEETIDNIFKLCWKELREKKINMEEKRRKFKGRKNDPIRIIEEQRQTPQQQDFMDESISPCDFVDKEFEFIPFQIGNCY